MTRLRLYVDGELVENIAVSAGDTVGEVLATAAALKASRHAVRAEETGRPWLVEIEFDDGEHLVAYYHDGKCPRCPS